MKKRGKTLAKSLYTILPIIKKEESVVSKAERSKQVKKFENVLRGMGLDETQISDYIQVLINTLHNDPRARFDRASESVVNSILKDRYSYQG